MEPNERDAWLVRLRAELNRVRLEYRTVTYLQLADALAIPPPHRIHSVTRLLELLLEDDVRAGRPPLAALAVSRMRGGLPAPGFFERARRLRLPVGENPAEFHARVLKLLYEESSTN